MLATSDHSAQWPVAAHCRMLSGWDGQSSQSFQCTGDSKRNLSDCHGDLGAWSQPANEGHGVLNWNGSPNRRQYWWIRPSQNDCVRKDAGCLLILIHVVASRLFSSWNIGTFFSSSIHYRSSRVKPFWKTTLDAKKEWSFQKRGLSWQVGYTCIPTANDNYHWHKMVFRDRVVFPDRFHWTDYPVSPTLDSWTMFHAHRRLSLRTIGRN